MAVVSEAAYWNKSSFEQVEEEDKVAKSQNVAGEQARQVSVQTFIIFVKVLSHAGHLKVDGLSWGQLDFAITILKFRTTRTSQDVPT